MLLRTSRLLKLDRDPIIPKRFLLYSSGRSFYRPLQYWQWKIEITLYWLLDSVDDSAVYRLLSIEKGIELFSPSFLDTFFVLNECRTERKELSMDLMSLGVIFTCGSLRTTRLLQPYFPAYDNLSVFCPGIILSFPVCIMRWGSFCHSMKVLLFSDSATQISS